MNLDHEPYYPGYPGITVGDEVFTDLDFADGVSLLSGMVEILMLAPEIVNWSKTMLQVSNDDYISLPRA